MKEKTFMRVTNADIYKEIQEIKKMKAQVIINTALASADMILLVALITIKI